MKNDRLYIIIIATIVVLTLCTGCVTNCIPVKPSGVIHDQTGDCYVIIEGVAYETVDPAIGPRTCSNIVPNQTNWVKFNAMINGGPICEVC